MWNRVVHLKLIRYYLTVIQQFKKKEKKEEKEKKLEKKEKEEEKEMRRKEREKIFPSGETKNNQTTTAWSMFSFSCGIVLFMVGNESNSSNRNINFIA